MILQVEGLNTLYGKSHVLHSLSMQVHRGSSVAVMGRNGVGKSTLLNSICGLVRPKSGRIEFEGEELSKVRPETLSRRGIAMVPQGRRLFKSLTVAEHLALAEQGASGITGDEWSRDSILDLFPALRTRLNQRGGSLSGGEQSMLAIARALSMRPKLLILDEPTEGLAPLYVDAVLEVLARLRAKADLSLLYVLPEFAPALSLADFLYVLSAGQIEFRGTPDELRERPDIQAKYIGIGGE